MFVGQQVHGRWVSAADFARLQALMAAHPEWSRRKLSVAVAALWDWRTATGQLRDMAVRTALNRLQERGFLALPARQRRGGQRWRPLLSAAQVPAAEPIGQTLAALQPLQWVLAQPGRRESALLYHYLQTHHYLGYGVAVGQKLEYLVRDRHGRDLAGLVFSAAAWQVACRDQFIGWSHPQRQQHLRRVVNNTRFLILPWVRVPNLASHVLSRAVRQLGPQWQAKYGLAPCLLETFVERERFTGSCYRAANWQRVGQTQGRSPPERFTYPVVRIQDGYLLPLQPTVR